MSRVPPGVHLPAGTKGESLISKIPSDSLKKIPPAQVDALRTLDLSKRPGIDYHGILGWIELLIGLYLISAFFNYLQSWIMSGVAQKVTFSLRRDIAAKMNRLPLRYFDTRTHGEVLSRVTNDVDTVSQTLNQSLTQLVTSATTLIGILVMMLTISWQMGQGFVSCPICVSAGSGPVTISRTRFDFRNDFAPPRPMTRK